MGVDVMRPKLKLEPKQRVTILTREEWTTGPGTPVVQGFVRYTEGFRMKVGSGLASIGNLWEEGTVFLWEDMLQVFRLRYVILVCAYEIQLYGRPEKYASICSDSQAALKALQTARTSPLVR
jgi:hypothetical protein